MEIKLFGKSLFEAKKSKGEAVYMEVTSPKARESKFLPDFHQAGGNDGNPLSAYVVVEAENGGMIAVPRGKQKPKKTKGKGKTIDVKITPKGVYELKTLNDTTFKLNTNPEYVEKQLADFKDKLGFIKVEEYDMRKGVEELTSVVMRLENRKKYPEVKDYFEQFPYTTTSKIVEMEKSHSHLKLGQIAQFIADMPKEAVEVMKSYNENTEKVCGKKAVFYIIADRKDFKSTSSRRDPILLAQSPFAHCWQILGAWDEEMLFLEEL